MPPATIIIARHSERADHMDPSFARTTPRPHDPPLTDNGVELARKLGVYLAKHYKLDLDKVIILSSPLVRCVMSARGITAGLLEATPSASQTTIPTYIEPTLAEAAQYMLKDMTNNPEVKTADCFHCPRPLFWSEAYFQENVSPHVLLDNPYNTHCEPHIEERADGIYEDDFLDRCRRGGRAIATHPLLDGKTVILVSHGETVLQLYDAIKGLEWRMKNPPYTGFAVLKNATPAGSAELSWELDSPFFTTPHLDASPPKS